MKAVLLDQNGARPTPKLALTAIPVPGPDEVLVQLKAAGLNYRELYWAQDGIDAAKGPIIQGGDGAGVIAQLGEGVQGWSVGERVVINPIISCGECRRCREGRPEHCEREQGLGWNIDGTFAEYVKIPAKNLSPIPAHLDFIGAAALPIAFGTAWRVLFTQGELKPGETVLIPGVGGGVALFALQLAAAIGAKAIVTSGSDEKLERALSMGAAHGINYKRSDVLTEVQRVTGGEGVDLAIDGLGAATLQTSFAATNAWGRVIRYGSLTGGTEIPTKYLAKSFKLGGVAVYSDWEAAMRFLAQVPLQPVIDKTFALEEFEAAYAHLKQQKQFGKIVFKIGE